MKIQLSGVLAEARLAIGACSCAVLLVVLSCSPGKSSTQSGNGGASGLQCGEGTVAEGGYCVPSDASIDGASGDAGAAGAGGLAGAGGGGTGGGSLDAGVDGHDAPDDAADDVADTTLTCTGKCGDPGCGVCPTMPVVNAERPYGDVYGVKYGIDAFETTVAEYQVFLDAHVPLQTDDACKLNETYEPDPFLFEFPYPDMPIHGVDWCDARAYCEWAGKRLCKENSTVGGEAARNEWYNACSLGGTQEYPYGDLHDPDACASNKAPHAPGSVLTCEGAYEGLFDMVGNMSEWTDDCSASDATHPAYTALCVVRGWSSAGCSGSQAFRMDAFATVGIRCCEDAW